MQVICVHASKPDQVYDPCSVPMHASDACKMCRLHACPQQLLCDSLAVPCRQFSYLVHHGLCVHIGCIHTDDLHAVKFSWTMLVRLSRCPDSLSSKSLHPATAPPEVCMHCCPRPRKLVSPLIAILHILSFPGFAEYHAVIHKERAGTSMHVATPPCCYP